MISGGRLFHETIDRYYFWNEQGIKGPEMFVPGLYLGERSKIIIKKKKWIPNRCIDYYYYFLYKLYRNWQTKNNQRDINAQKTFRTVTETNNLGLRELFDGPTCSQ